METWGTTSDSSDDDGIPPSSGIELQMLHAPWTTEQVDTLNLFQASGVMHPFTCGGELHRGQQSPTLVADIDGWRCPVDGCNYRQSWAHSFMADPETVANMNDQHARLLGEFFDSRRQRRRGAAKVRAAHAVDAGVDPQFVDEACEVMHDAYEKAALGTGWVTNPESRKPWADVPEANKQTMRAAVTALITWLEAE